MPDDVVTPPPGNTTDLPEWARKAISDANSEAAARRVDLRVKTDELTAANNRITELTNEKASAADTAATAATNLLKLNVALSAGIPGDKAVVFAARLQGATEDELKADAEQLKGAFGAGGSTPPATDPSQGRGASTTSTPATPQAEMAEFLQTSFESIFAGKS